MMALKKNAIYPLELHFHKMMQKLGNLPASVMYDKSNTIKLKAINFNVLKEKNQITHNYDSCKLAIILSDPCLIRKIFLTLGWKAISISIQLL